MQRSTSRARGLALVASMTIAWTLALAACSSSAGAAAATPPVTQAPATPAASPSPSPSASAAATATASAATERTYVSGTMGCDTVKETPIEGVEHTVRLTLDCPFEMSDPRVTGSGPMECDEGFYDLTDLPGGVGVWDTCSGVLTGQGGSWKIGLRLRQRVHEVRHSPHQRNQRLRGPGRVRWPSLRDALFSASPELKRLYGESYHVAGWIEPTE